MVDIGKLNRRITFLSVQTVEDEMGQDRPEWKKYKTVWATVKPYKSSEHNFMSKLKPETTHRIYIRHRTDITADMRILYRGHIYEISGPPVDLDGEHRMLEIQCEEVFDGTKYQSGNG